MQQLKIIKAYYLIPKNETTIIYSVTKGNKTTEKFISFLGKLGKITHYEVEKKLKELLKGVAK